MENFLLFILIASSFYSNQEQKKFYFAFFLGLFIDLWSGELIGRTSLSFLIITFLADLYSRKYSSGHFIFQAVFTFVSVWILDFIKGGLWTFGEGLFWAIFSSLGLFVIKKISSNTDLKLEI